MERMLEKGKNEILSNFHLRPIAIRSRSSAESFTEKRSSIASVQSQSHMAAMEELGSVRTPSAGNASISMKLDGDNCEESEYWSSEDASENGDDNEQDQGKSMTLSMGFLVPTSQIPATSTGYQTRPQAGTTKETGGIVEEDSLKTSSSATRSKKRIRESDRDHESDDDDQKRKKASGRVGNPRRFLVRSDKFACPFFQRRPERHQNEVCTGPGFTDMKSLKYYLLMKVLGYGH